MLVRALELPASWGAPQRALAEVERRLVNAPHADLVLLPEQSLNGYVSPAGEFDLAPYAETLDGPTAQACARVASTHRVYLVAPLVLREGDAIYNATICHAPDGTQPFVYRKRHPWIPETWATPGSNELPLVTIGNMTVTIAVCYDLHFLLDGESADALDAADLLLFPSAWVECPDNRLSHLAQLARQANVAVLNANWAPGVVLVPGQGGSCAIARDGTVLAVAPLAGHVDLIVG